MPVASILRRLVAPRQLAIALVAVTALAVAACGSNSSSSSSTKGGATAQKHVDIAYLVATQAAGYPVGMLKAARAEAAKLGASIEVFDAQFDPSKQVAQCQDAITKGTFGAIVTLAAASPPMVVCARQAAQAKIPLIAANTPIGTDLSHYAPTVPGVTSQVIVPATVAWGPTGIGDLLPNMCKQVKGTCDVAFIEGVQALALSGVAVDGVKKTVAEHPNMKLSGICVGNYQRQGGLSCMQDMLQKDPNINVLVSQSDDMALGAESVLKEKGKIPGKDVFIGTQGGSVQGVARIHAGQWYGSIISAAQPEGAIPIQLAVDAARGKQVKPYVDPLAATGLPLVFEQTNKAKYPAFQGQFTG